MFNSLQKIDLSTGINENFTKKQVPGARTETRVRQNNDDGDR